MIRNIFSWASHDLLNAITFETASASLFLHLACGSMASSSTVTVPSGRGELHILLVDSWRETEWQVTPFPLCEVLGESYDLNRSYNLVTGFVHFI